LYHKYAVNKKASNLPIRIFYGMLD